MAPQLTKRYSSSLVLILALAFFAAGMVPQSSLAEEDNSEFTVAVVNINYRTTKDRGSPALKKVVIARDLAALNPTHQIEHMKFERELQAPSLSQLLRC